MQKSKN
jgi:hypothetical protein